MSKRIKHVQLTGHPLLHAIMDRIGSDLFVIVVSKDECTIQHATFTAHSNRKAIRKFHTFLNTHYPI